MNIRLPQEVKNRNIDTAMWSALKTSVYPGARDESILLAVDYCTARKLDVMKKPVHIVPMYVTDVQTGKKEYRDVIMPGIYEQRTTAFKTGQMAGQDDPVFGDTTQMSGIEVPQCCRVTVYRFIKGERCAFSHTEYFKEACATKKDGGLNAMWSKRPRGQLAKCAEAGALRKAFPDELGGVMTAEELESEPEQNIVNHVINEISEVQIANLTELLETADKDEEKMLSWVSNGNAEKIENLTEEQFFRAKKELDRAVEKKKNEAVEAEFVEVEKESPPPPKHQDIVEGQNVPF